MGITQMRLATHIVKLVFLVCIISNLTASADESLDEGIPQTKTNQPQTATFGESLFNGKYSSQGSNNLDPNYIISPGDKVSLHIWGAIQVDEISTIDSQGNLFIPEVGAVKAGGIRANELPDLVKRKLNSVYKDGVEAYVNLLSGTLVNVFVTGPVTKPGQYSGIQTDSVINYLRQAGGILKNQGSYRNIKILRQSRPIASVDLYTFLRFGQLPNIRFQNGDTILVSPQRSVINVEGDARANYRYEFTQANSYGKDLISIARPDSSSTNVALSGSRNRQPWSVYLSLPEFSRTKLYDGDTVRFVSDSPSRSIDIAIEGSHLGNSYFAAKRGVRLKELLDYVAIAPDEADIENIYVKRKSVAATQRRNLLESIDRLERSILTAPARSDAEASIRQQESTLISQFITNARKAVPDGRVVVSENTQVANIRLEDGDIIVIPYKSDVITVSGEVKIPQSIVFSSGASINDYIVRAGGYTERADTRSIIIRKPNGQIVTTGEIRPGDELLVFPKIATKNFQFAKDILSIVFQIAATSKAVGII